MLGDIHDTKRCLAQVLDSELYRQFVRTAYAEKLIYEPELQDPFTLRFPTVHREEKASQQLFPVCELLAYRTTYPTGVADETMVKIGTHSIGIRWTVLHDKEEQAAGQVEVLIRGTVDMLWNEQFAGYLTQSMELNAGSVIVQEEDYGPLMPNDKNAFLKSALVVVEITTYRS